MLHLDSLILQTKAALDDIWERCLREPHEWDFSNFPDEHRCSQLENNPCIIENNKKINCMKASLTLL